MKFLLRHQRKLLYLSEYDELVNNLLQIKPDLTREKIGDLVRQKKEKIGAGYLTDQGAIYLIASDFGVKLEEPQKLEMKLKDLYAGAKEVTLETRILNVSPIRQFTRKDGSSSFLKTITVYDDNSTASVKLWDEKANLPQLSDLKPGDLIKIIKAYVKSDLNGNPTINIGSGSSIEPSNEISEIPSIDEITIDSSQIKDGIKDAVVSGILDGTISEMSFTNSRGEPGKAIRFRLKGNDGNITRVVIWGKDESEVPKMILQDSKVKLLGVRVKQGMQGLEIHGNESTIIEIKGGKEIEPIAIRIISKQKSDSGNVLIFATDAKKLLYNISDYSKMTDIFTNGDVIEVMPSKVFGNSITIDDNSFVRKIDDDGSIANLDELRTKINEIKIGDTCCIEAIILKIESKRDIQTKQGETISLSEMWVEDDSGQVWIKGWRNQSRLIDKCSIGEIVTVTNLSARSGLEGRLELNLSSSSEIIKKN